MSESTGGLSLDLIADMRGRRPALPRPTLLTTSSGNVRAWASPLAQRSALVRELDQFIESRGCPRMIAGAIGTEFTSNTILARQEERRVDKTK
jgi:hypothetical protein